MKKLLPIIIVLLIVCLIPGFVGASESGNGTGIFALDLVIFVAVPFIVIVFLMLFLFKLPSEIYVSPARAKAPSRAAPKKETLAYEPAPFEEMKPAEPEITCPECGGIVTMTDPACPHCGAKFEEEGTVEEPEKVPAAGPTPEVLAEPEPIDELELAEPEPITEISEPKERQDAKDFGLKCPTCGGNVGLEEKICPHCGADFEQKASVKDLEHAKSEEELDTMLGIAPEEKPEGAPEQKPAQEKPSDITLSFEETVEEAPAPKKKGKRKR